MKKLLLLFSVFISGFFLISSNEKKVDAVLQRTNAIKRIKLPVCDLPKKTKAEDDYAQIEYVDGQEETPSRKLLHSKNSPFSSPKRSKFSTDQKKTDKVLFPPRLDDNYALINLDFIKHKLLLPPGLGDDDNYALIDPNYIDHGFLNRDATTDETIKEESIYFNEQVGELNGVPPVFKKQPISESIYEEPVPLSLSRQVSRLSVSESPSSEIASIKTKLSSVRSSIDLFSMHPSSNLTTPSPTRVFLAARSRSAQHLFLLPQPNTRLTLARSSSVNSLEDFEADLFINPKEEQKK